MVEQKSRSHTAAEEAGSVSWIESKEAWCSKREWDRTGSRGAWEKGCVCWWGVAVEVAVEENAEWAEWADRVEEMCVSTTATHGHG